MIEVPYALDDERAVIGSCINHPRAYENARLIVSAADFGFPGHARLFDGCEQLVGINDPDERVRRVARLADVAVEDVLRLVDLAPVLWDPTAWAQRVYEAARRRRLIAEFDSALRKLGDGEDIDAVLTGLGQ